MIFISSRIEKRTIGHTYVKRICLYKHFYLDGERCMLLVTPWSLIVLFH